MSTDTIDRCVRLLIAEQLAVAADELKLESALVSDLGADSLDIVELLMAVEDEFSIDVTEADEAAMTTVGDVVAYVERRLAA